MTENVKVKKAHSVKVPRLYKEAAKALQKVEEDGEGLKSAIYAIKHPNTKALTALVSESLKRSSILELMLTKSKIRESEPRLSVFLAKILITELLWGKKRISGEAKPVLTIQKYADKFESILKKLERKNRNSSSSINTNLLLERQVIRKPRYARVNTIYSTTEDVILSLENEGWEMIDPPEDYLHESFNGSVFCKDTFVQNLLVFPPNTEFHNHPFYLNGTIVLQDKASCLPSLALHPRRGRFVIDACAAPGMKTSHLASIMSNEGKILALEKSVKRTKTLEEMKEWLGLETVEVKNGNFTDLDPKDYPDAEFILIDPSCTGSGMYGRVDADLSQTDPNRLESLSFYQKKLLLHAMTFPSVKRIVYSTCSVNAQENEDVIADVLRRNNNFELKNALPQWPHRLYNNKYPWSSYCVISDYEQDRTDGFFVSVLTRKKAK